MFNKPASVQAVGLILCLLGVIGIPFLPSPSLLNALSSVPGNNDVMPVWMSADDVKAYNIDHWEKIIVAVGTLVCGIFILLGENWARWAYALLCLGVIGYVAVYAGGELLSMVPVLVVSNVCVIVLFLPNANEFFTHRSDHWDD